MDKDKAKSITRLFGEFTQVLDEIKSDIRYELDEDVFERVDKDIDSVVVALAHVSASVMRECMSKDEILEFTLEQITKHNEGA